MWIDMYRDTAEPELGITDDEIEEVGFDYAKTNFVSVDVPTMLLLDYIQAYDYFDYGDVDGFLKEYMLLFKPTYRL